MRWVLVFLGLGLSAAHAETYVHRDTNGNRTGSTVCQGSTCTNRDVNGNRRDSYVTQGNTIIHRDTNGNTLGRTQIRR